MVLGRRGPDDRDERGLMRASKRRAFGNGGSVGPYGRAEGGPNRNRDAAAHSETNRKEHVMSKQKQASGRPEGPAG